MDDPKWLRLITIGLVLAAVAVGYFLFTGRFSPSKVSKTPSGISQASPSATANATVSVKPTPTPTPASVTAYNMIAERTTKGGQKVETLPRTGFPIGLVATLSASIMLVGWGLKRFPH